MTRNNRNHELRVEEKRARIRNKGKEKIRKSRQ